MSKFNQYRTFVAIAETGSLSAASKALNITPSAVSKQVSALEASLDTALLERSNKHVSLTPEGQRFYTECTKILDAVKLAEENIRSNQVRIAGTLTISFPSSLARARCMEIFSLFTQQHPEIRLDLRLTDDVEELTHGKLDFAFRLGDPRINNRLTAEPLCQTQLIMCATKRYLDECGTVQHPADLDSHRFVLTKPDKWSHVLRTYVKDNQITFPKSATHITGDSEATYQLVSRDCGIGIFLELSVENELDQKTFINASPATKLPSKPLYLVSKRIDQPSPKHQLFKTFVTEYFNAHTP